MEGTGQSCNLPASLKSPIVCDTVFVAPLVPLPLSSVRARAMTLVPLAEPMPDAAGLIVPRDGLETSKVEGCAASPGKSRNDIARTGIALVVAATALYFSVLLGMSLRFPSSAIAICWPANAVLLAALLVTPASRWWLFVATSIGAQLVAMKGLPVWRGLWPVGGSTLLVCATA